MKERRGKAHARTKNETKQKNTPPRARALAPSLLSAPRTTPSAAQIATRAITFLLNLATARRLSVSAYGVAAVQFHLVNSAVLLLAREGLRRGCLTAGQQQQQQGGEGGGRGRPPPALPTRQVLATAGLAL